MKIISCNHIISIYIIGQAFQSNLDHISAIAIDHFGIAADQAGVLSSYVGCIAMLMQGFGISLMTSRFSYNTLLRSSTTFLATSFIILVSIHGFYIVKII